ncbi:hypothetical protein DSM112329_04216 [Paraconexibacter sp. AEG42_29]|uniref:Alpha/beta hydrolase n=1 Tax=Paraconexibacter sp. AEG42_29 TaxID=2997339 RepID=A0AAU7B0B8_9ACTN
MPEAQVPRGVASGRASIFYEGLAALEYRQLVVDPIFAGEGVMPGTGRPVLVIPGFLAPDVAVLTMVRWLRSAGYHAAYPKAGPNIMCGEVAIGRMESRLEELVKRQGQRAVVIGHSRGGQLARVLSVRRPDLIQASIKLGTPGLIDRRDTHPAVRLCMHALTGLQRLGIPGIFGESCFTGACCDRFRADLHKAMPPAVELTCVIGRRDGLVDRQACVDPAASHVVQVDASHIGTIVNPASYRAIAAVLGKLDSAHTPPARRAA